MLLSWMQLTHKKENVTFTKAYIFATKVVELYKTLIVKNEFVLSRQLLKSGTSIGANISEANGAISPADFSAKISIAYKESLETKYWLSLLKDTGYISLDTFAVMNTSCDEISKILFAILKTTRIKPKC